MSAIFRDTVAGYFIRFISGKKLLPYPEEIPGFQIPKPQYHASSSSDSLEKVQDRDGDSDAKKIDTARDNPSKDQDIESGILQPSSSQVIQPEVTKDGIILVDWYSTEDPENPYNWTSAKKIFVCGQICLLTYTVYFGSSAFAPSIPGLVEQFGITEVVASLGLSLYVIAYGLGALVWSPLSEIPALGRNGLYIATFFIYTILMIPAAMTNSFAGLMVLRFLTGWFGSPCTATSPGSFADVLKLNKLPYVLALWSSSASIAPAIGPIAVGYAVQSLNWHWSMWELLWLSSFVFIFLFCFLPETSADNILLRRAARLRKLTGNPLYKSQSEINQNNMSPKAIAFDALIRPWAMNIKDPAILFSTFYVALCYAIFYCFFEAFPIVFTGMHGMSLGSTGLTFIAIPAGLVIAIPIQLFHYGYIVEPTFAKSGPPAPEFWLKPALAVTFFGPIGLFIFAWTSSASIHWAVPLVGVIAFQAAMYQVINSLFAYIANIYPKYAASLFAANAAARSCLAGGAILFSRPMFEGLGVGGGVSVLAGVTCLCSVLLFVLYRFGPALRARSKFVSA